MYVVFSQKKPNKGNQTISLTMNLKECGSDAIDCTYVSFCFHG